MALHRQGAMAVEPVHDRIAGHLAEIESLADKDHERILSERARFGFAAYRDAYAGGRPANELLDLLREPLTACHELREYNAGQIEESDRDHRRAIRRMSWGLALVGGLGSIAGLVLGYGLARGLRRTIHQFLVRVQGASDLLGQELPAVEWDSAGGRPGDGADDLVLRVEQVVQKLHQREREVRRAERLAALGQLAAGVAHEVRNPLAAVILLVETGRRDPAAGGLTDEDLDLIEQELHRIERSLRGFLDYARPPRPEPTDCDLADVVRDAAALTRARAEQQLVIVRLVLPRDPVPLHADPQQLRQVILNLVLNALDVMPGGGEVSVSLAQTDHRYVELIVADRGPGISAQVLPRLFEPFVSGKDTGLGLGLVISKRIVEDHGGTIRGENRPGGGAAFVVRLPAASGKHLRSPAISPNGVPACQPCS
jgi:two-component system sensor histidine kinase HydH